MNASSALVCSLANLPINAPVESRFWSLAVPARPQIRHFERTPDQASAAIVAYTCGAIADDEEGLQACGFDDSLDKSCTVRSLDGCLLRWCAPGYFDDLPVRRLANTV